MGGFNRYNEGPSKEELETIEAEATLLTEEAKNLDLKEVADSVKDETGSLIENGGVTWCEAASNLDGYTSSDKSALDNADELGNTASPHTILGKKD